MTGSSKSTVDQASEFEIEKIYQRFVEYAVMKKREYVNQSIEKAIIQHNLNSNSDSVNKPVMNISSNSSIDNSTTTSIVSGLGKYNGLIDYHNYKYFKLLVGITNDDAAVVKSINISSSSESTDTTVDSEVDTPFVTQKYSNSSNNNINNVIDDKFIINRQMKSEMLLSQLIDETMNQNDYTKTIKDYQYEEIYNKARQERLDFLEVFQ